jgi:hypothetical protein
MGRFGGLTRIWGNRDFWGILLVAGNRDFWGFLLVAGKSRFLTSFGMTRAFSIRPGNDKTGRASLDGRGGARPHTIDTIPPSMLCIR